MDILELEQELDRLILERNEVNKIPRVLKLPEDNMLLDNLRANVKKIRARIKAIKNKETYYNLENIKKRKISRWKNSGICSRDWDNLYNMYINTNKCNHCKIILVNYKLKMTNNTKVLHHDHNTNKPIAIVCNLCNIREGEFLKDKYNFSIKQNENIY